MLTTQTLKKPTINLNCRSNGLKSIVRQRIFDDEYTINGFIEDGRVLKIENER